MLQSLFLLSLLCFCTFADGIQLIVVNNCKDYIWPAILGTAGHPTLNDGGFPLRSGQQVEIEAPQWWSGRMWARQGCCFDQSGKGGSCQTGDCARGQLRCGGTGGEPPATVIEMTLGTPNNPAHYYDVSLVDGFNLPVSMVPLGGRGCSVAACEADVNGRCPEWLAVRREGRVVGCKSACVATGTERECCTGKYGSREACRPTAYAGMFKAVCPRAYSYAFDEASGLQTCQAKRYVITFCPPN